MARATKIDEIELAIRDLGPKFKAYSNVPGEFRADGFIGVWRLMIEQGMGTIFTFEHNHKIVGLLGAILVPDMVDGKVLASEAFWFVDPDHRGTIGSVRLFREFETWAKEVGADRILTAHLDTAMSGNLEKFYEHSGYTKVETLYRKELT